MDLNFFYSAVLMTLMCALVGLITNLIAFQRFAVLTVRPVLGWTIASQATMCAALAAVEAFVLVERLGQDGWIRPWSSQADSASIYLTITKVILSTAMVFSSVMMLGILWRIERVTLLRAAVCSVTWAIVAWLLGALAFEFLF